MPVEFAVGTAAQVVEAAGGEFRVAVVALVGNVQGLDDGQQELALFFGGGSGGGVRHRLRPVSAITHYAEIASIEKWSDTNKYILKFKDAAKAIGPISLDKEMGKKGLAPQAPRYTSFDKLLKAKKLSQVF